MDEPISATDANRYFSALIRGVQVGQSYVVTSHGRPVARIVPIDEPDPSWTESGRVDPFRGISDARPDSVVLRDGDLLEPAISENT